MPQNERTLVLGSAGQIGTDLVEELRRMYGAGNVIATDIKDQPEEFKARGPFIMMDVLDGEKVNDIIKKNNVKQVFLLAALLSATAEQKMKMAWKLNMDGLFIMLDICKENKDIKLFWPSSIAVFGPTTPRINTPQHTIMEPTTVYGVSKQAGERWCEYYHNKFGVDVRSIRYPGLISYKAEPGGGTTDYAVNIFHDAVLKNTYECFLKEDTALPMMYMPDAIRATIELMNAPADKIKIRSSYNLGGISFTPKVLVEEIKKHMSDFTCTYKPDFRQAIADSWPASIDDSVAQQQWNWKQKYDLAEMTKDMLVNIKEKYKLAI
jgi:nucleoside-diphosphate-sugar epimerase